MASSAPFEPAYSQTAAYKEHVTSFLMKTEFPAVIEGVSPVVSSLRFHHLGVVCRDPAASLAFYARLGFIKIDGGDVSEARGAGIVRLRHENSLELHLIQADAPQESPEPRNVLMDTPDLKYPGHTHGSWSVPSVPGVKAFLEAQGISLSGTRSTLAVFVRDVDRTTLEFERNDGGDDAAAASVFDAAFVGRGHPLDHVGVRVRAPYERHLEWYARNLGFNALVNKYPANEEPLKNFPPWITRSSPGCDINFIINCNTPALEGAEDAENVLSRGGLLSPGIFYAALLVRETDARDIAARLRAGGVAAALDSELDGWWPGCPPSAIRPLGDGRETVLVRDLNGTLLRIVPSPLADAA